MRLGAALTASLLTAAPAHAGDWAYQPFDPPPATYTGDFGPLMESGRDGGRLGAPQPRR